MTEYMAYFVKKNWISLLIIVVLLLAGIFNRPVKVSVSDNIFIEMGIEEVNIGVIKNPATVTNIEGVIEEQEGPPEQYRATIELTEGKTVYVLMDGSCKVR